jgi:cytosine/adenosine deaminase-related metal-dependent hydrolase
MKAFINATLYDFESFRENQYVLFEDEIIQVGPMDKFPGADEITDAIGCVLMPGLLNAHAHIYSTFARGMSVPFDPKSFQDILDQLWWKLDAKLDKESVYYSGLVSACECIQNGVTTVIDHHASGLYIKGSLNELKRSVCDEMGLRGIFCFETSDRFDIDECIEENIEFASHKSERCAGLFGMHASLSLSDDTLRKISQKTGDIPVHVHAAESIEDEDDCIKKC